MDTVSIKQEEPGTSTENSNYNNYIFIKLEPTEQTENSEHNSIDFEIDYERSGATFPIRDDNDFKIKQEYAVKSEIKQEYTEKSEVKNYTPIISPNKQIKVESTLKYYYDNPRNNHGVNEHELHTDDSKDCLKYKKIAAAKIQPVREDGKTYQCKVCFKYFISEERLLRHIDNGRGLPGIPLKCKKKRTKPNIFYYCNMCESKKGYRYKQHLIRHMKVHSKCKICHQTLTSPKDLQIHLETHKSIKCTCCEARFDNHPALREHIKLVHGEKPYACDICQARCSTSSSLISHKASIHNNIRPHVCPICKKQFSTRSKLRLHDAVHSERRPFQCKMCLKWFKNTERLHSHKKMVHEKCCEKHVCDVCNREYTTKRRLLEHKMIHSNSPPEFECAVCKKTFIYKYLLKNHTLVHTEERPHVCKLCGKNYALKSRLSDHMKKVHLSKEKKTKVKAVVFECAVCGKSFRHKYLLKNHIVVHTGERPHACKLCGKNYTLKSNLTVHIKRVHLNKENKSQSSGVARHS